MLKRLLSRFGMNNLSRVRDRNIVLTGPGRSGTTLTCYLLNKLTDTVALSEPISPVKYADRMPDSEAVVDGIEEFYRNMCVMALEQGHVVSKHVGGKVPDNSKGVRDGVRQRIAEKSRIAVGKDLAPDFYLAIKQPGIFTALLPTLTKRLPCYAIVRNPLAIMASTSTLQQPRHRKNPTARVRYDPELAEHLAESVQRGDDKIERRLLRLHNTFERYLKELPEEHILRYEDIVASKGRVLSGIVPAARELDEPLENKNANSLYERETALKLGERLLRSEGAYWHLYSRQDVRAILDAFD